MSNKNLKYEVISVKGMHCNSCVKLIENKISQLKGVENVKASLTGDKVFVQFDPKEIKLNDIKEEIRDAGYTVDGRKGKSADTGGKGEKNGLVQGIIYGLAAHTGCIAFIIATVLGTTVATELFKPLMMNPYFFYILIALSFVFATISSVIYLKNQGFITFRKYEDRIDIDFANNILGRKWKYLTSMYGSTIITNLLLFFLIFPALANLGSGISSTSPTGSVVLAGGNQKIEDFSLLTMKVAIPCPGHAPLISGELKKLDGVLGVKYKSPNIFDVAYDPDIILEDEMLSLKVFEVYKPTVIENNAKVDSSALDSGFDDETVGGGCGCGKGPEGGCCGCGAV